MTENDAAANASRVRELIDRGVKIPFPDAVSIGAIVPLDRIAPGTTLFAGVRLDGDETWVGPGAVIGEEGPAAILDCQLGPDVRLKGGSFRGSTFLAGSSLGLGAHVRPGCLLEEQASGAHTVGLKQTILMPWVTLGSLANFCDCLMAGGTSRRDHSEVGSSYIHFNFTPHQDKATASLFGDVPRGVMLDQPPVFLGGQGGTVGPVRLGFGTVVAAGTIVRKDVPKGRTLLTERPASPDRPAVAFVQGCYRSVERIVRNNVVYIGNLHALRVWYDRVRRRFFSSAEAPLVAGAIARLDAGLAERLKRLRGLADKMPRSVDLARAAGIDASRVAQQVTLGAEGGALVGALAEPPEDDVGAADRDTFIRGLDRALDRGEATRASYLEVIPGLDDAIRAAGTAWLDEIVRATAARAQSRLPGFTIST